MWDEHGRSVAWAMGSHPVTEVSPRASIMSPSQTPLYSDLTEAGTGARREQGPWSPTPCDEPC